ncbi:Uncharacterised protein [Oligella urethralis]|nr:hypothetical protein [Oligella urethralis]SUA59785.1 Uncharacterised protein [Oligella urethralis]
MKRSRYTDSQIMAILKQAVLRATLETVVEQIGDEQLPFQHLLYVGEFLR